MIKHNKIGIIGGGAAGMMCAARILETNSDKNIEIHIFDKNPRLGVKVSMTGGGRCNLTTSIVDMKILLSKYVRGANFLSPSLAYFSPQNVRDWFINHGVPLKEEQGNRIFPVSDKGEDIVEVFENLFKDNRVQLHFNSPVLFTTKKRDMFIVKTPADEYELKYLVITTGGDGYELVKSLGHGITKLGASLNSFTTKEEWTHTLAGVSLEKARFDFELNPGQNKSVMGPMIFTHSGISGPAVFTLSANIAFEKISLEKPFRIKYTPNGDFNFDKCDSFLINEITRNGLKPLISILMQIIPRSLGEIILELAGIITVAGAELTKKERQHLSHFLSGDLLLTLISRTAGVEFVTAGGVVLDEVNRKTMRSKIHKNLFLAGEVLNVDGLTGGFNLQAAWSTGRTAGNTIASLL